MNKAPMVFRSEMRCIVLPNGVNGCESSVMIPVPGDLAAELVCTPQGKLMMVETHGELSAVLQVLVERAVSLFLCVEEGSYCVRRR
jgi:hypothetical protein